MNWNNPEHGDGPGPEPRYPISVKLVGEDGNAFTIIGLVTRALKEEGVPSEEINEFQQEAMASDYDNLLRTCMDWVEVV